MKGLKKLALVTAVAAAPFAQAELTAMDDALLGEMTGQAGITIDVDLDMTIEAIKYVDQDGNRQLELAAGGAGTGGFNADGTVNATGDYEYTGSQGAITMAGLQIGSDNGTGDWDAATIRGITIDADGTDGLVIGLNQIGDNAGNGIDISVNAVLINNGSADLAKTQVGAAISTSTQGGAAAALAVGDGAFADPTAYGAALAAGDQTAIGYLAAVDATVAGAIANAQDGTTGNIGGFKIENFRNFIQDDLVNKYNGVFSMALQDSNGTVGGVTGAAGTTGRFVRGEIVINGTGTYDPTGAASTGGLEISGEFGGAIDKAAWVDTGGGEFGIADLGFFKGNDTNGDNISDVITGMHFSVDIDVVDHASSVAGVNSVDGSAIASGATVSALRISDMQIDGTIMMGNIYVGNEAGTVATSLGSVLIKDIDMTGTSVYVYGH